VSPSITLSVLSKHQRAEGLGMECTVPVEVHLATDHADVGSLERTISEALVEVSVRLWRELVDRLEQALPVPVGCAACGGAMKANGRARRRLVTLAGEVELRRRRYRCTACGTETVPLDAALGLEPRVQHTLGVRERGLWLVTEMSYQKAVETAAELRRWPIGRGELHRWVADEGAALEAARATETEAVLGAHPDRRTRPPRRAGTVWVSADGTMVHDRATGTELEVKIGLVFDGARRVGRTRRALTGRTLDAGTESWTAFAERFTALCTRLGVYEADRICFVSDGAAAIRWIRERAFPTAIELLDWYHLVEALRSAIGADGATGWRPRSRWPLRAMPSAWPSSSPVGRTRRPGSTSSARTGWPPSAAMSSTTGARSRTTRSSRWPPRARWRRRSTSSSPAASRPAA
jgi:hypothetical protein